MEAIIDEEIETGERLLVLADSSSNRVELRKKIKKLEM